MSFTVITVDIQRDTVTATAGGGETYVSSAVYSGLSCTIGYPDKSAVDRYETSGKSGQGPGRRTKSDRVVYFDPWDGSTPTVNVDDRVVPNPSVAYLPSSMRVVAVRPYEDGALSELQLDVEDRS